MDDWASLFEQALDQIVADGIEMDRQDVIAYRLSRVNAGGSGKLVSVDWGLIVEGAYYLTQETRIGALSYNAIDFGERILLSQVIRGHIDCGDPREINQCTFLHLCAGLEWVRQHHPKGVPSRSRLGDFAKNLREKDVGEANKIAESSQGFPYAADVVSVTHDVSTPRHGRDFRAICLFLLDDVLKLEIQAIRIAEVNEDSTSTIVRNLALSKVCDGSNPLYFISHRGHMGWLHPSVITGIQLWKDWRSNFDCILDITVMNWQQFALSIVLSTIVPMPCRGYGQAAKVPTPSDALCGGPAPPRKRKNLGYNELLFHSADGSRTAESKASIPLEERTGAVEERSTVETATLRPIVEEVAYLPPV